MRTHIIVSGLQCEVERLSVTAGQRARGWPVARVLAPDGFVFSGGETALEAHSAAALDEIERHESLSDECEAG